MNALHIDTLKFSRRLIEAGMEPRAAEAIVETIAEVDTSELATKSDIRDIEGRLRDLEHRMTIKMGGMLMAAVAALTAILRLLPPAG